MTDGVKKCVVLALIVLFSGLVGLHGVMGLEQRLAHASFMLDEMKEFGAPHQRFADSLLLANDLYQGQLALELAGGDVSFDQVHDLLDELELMRISIYEIMDEIALLSVLASESSVQDVSSVYAFIEQARDALSRSRFDEALSVIDQGYRELSRLESTETQLRAMYQATTNSVLEFLDRYGKGLLIAGIIMFSVLLLIRGSLLRYILHKKINTLEHQRKAVEHLMADTQREYFSAKTIGEDTYRVRMRKYGEFVRDIGRKIPLLQEQLAFYNKEKISFSGGDDNAKAR